MIRSNEPSNHSDAGSLVWAAAVAGLLGCGDSKKAIEPDPVQPDAAVVVDAPPPIDAPPDAPPQPTTKITKRTEVTHTYAELTAMCEAAKGWVNVHASCAGTNLCAGFSYFDGDPGELIEHTCNAVNSCAGLSCLVGPADSGLTGKQLYENNVGDVEGVTTRNCTNCHADWSGEQPDFGKFGVYVRADDGRDLTNWKTTRTAEVQQRMVALGTVGVYREGVGYSHMAAYGKRYSRAEIARVVDYLRALPDDKLMIHTIKFADPATPVGGSRPPWSRGARRSRGR